MTSSQNEQEEAQDFQIIWNEAETRRRREAKEDWEESFDGPEEGTDPVFGTTYRYRVERFSWLDFVMYRIRLTITGGSLGRREIDRYLTYEDYNRFIGDGVNHAWSWGMIEPEMRVYILELKMEEINDG